MLAVSNGRHHQLACDAVTTNQLNDDVNVGMINDYVGVINDFDLATSNLLCTCGVEVSDHRDFNRTPCPTTYFFCIARKDSKSTSTDSADTEQTNFDRFHDE